MIEKKDIEHLANLARIEITDSEKESLAKDAENILGFVGQIQSVSSSEEKKEVGLLRNVMREDSPPAGGPHETGVYTEQILKEAPDREGDFIKGKNIL